MSSESVRELPLMKEQLDCCWRVKSLSGRAVFVAPHCCRPTTEEVNQLMGRHFPDINDEKRIKLAIRLGQRYEAGTSQIAQIAAEESEASVMLARESRLWADPNRSISQSLLVSDGVWLANRLISPLRSSILPRYSWYQNLTDLVDQTVGLSQEGKALAPFMQVVIHGMEPRQDSDGNGYEDDGILVNFSLALAYRMGQSVAIDCFDKSLVTLIRPNGRKMLIKRVGPVCGPNYSQPDSFRWGEQIAQFNWAGLGPNLQTIQLEIGPNIRKNSVQRGELAQVLAKTVKSFI